MFIKVMINLRHLIYKMCHPSSRKYLSYKQAKRVIKERLSEEFIYKVPSSVDKFSTEHIFPQSYFKNHDDRLKMKSDLHHLYPCIMSINSTRNNYKFDNIDSSDDEVEYTVDHKNRTFEPDRISKGNTARACAYIYCAYSDSRILEIIDVETIIQWNRMDPVSNIEIMRNNIIMEIQGNRNPFIDYPELIDELFNSD